MLSTIHYICSSLLNSLLSDPSLPFPLTGSGLNGHSSTSPSASKIENIVVVVSSPPIVLGPSSPPIKLLIPVIRAPGIATSSKSPVPSVDVINPLPFFAPSKPIPRLHALATLHCCCRGLCAPRLVPATNMMRNAVSEIVETETQDSICCQR